MDDPPAPGSEDLDYRFTLANERTFLAWLRTALALMAGGIAVTQLVPGFGSTGVRQAIGVALAALGVAVACGGTVRWQRVQRAMERGAALPPSRLPLLLVGVVAVLGAVVVVVLLPWPG